MVFWIAAALLSVALLVALIVPGRRAGAAGGASALPLADQAARALAQIDQDIDRGTLDPGQAEALRTEIKRRYLSMGSEAPLNANEPQRALILLCLIAVPVVTLATYLWLGHPGLGDLAKRDRLEGAKTLYSTRPSQTEMQGTVDETADDVGRASLQDLSLLEQLRASIVEHPESVEGYRHLVDFEASLGNYARAWQAQATLIRLTDPADVTDAELMKQSELMVAAAQGKVSPEAEAVITAALNKNAQNESALYLLGLLALQTGRPDAAFDIWNELYTALPPDNRYVRDLNLRLPEVAAMAGATFTERTDFVADLPNPAMEGQIDEMVEGMKARLFETGGSLEEWKMLIHSLVVQGDMVTAAEAQSRALAIFEGDKAAQDAINKAFDEAGGFN